MVIFPSGLTFHYISLSHVSPRVLICLWRESDEGKEEKRRDRRRDKRRELSKGERRRHHNYY
jgi:hypothetical protein